MSHITVRSQCALHFSGGHESGNFSLLPHDLPLHSGFSGCLFDVELRAGRIAVALQRIQPATGRSVGQCGTSECHEHACQHGGACLHHGATYTYV
jgi:EYS protein